MDISKYQHIRIRGYFGKWSAYDSYTDEYGDDLIFLQNDDLRDEALRLVCRAIGESGLELVSTFTVEPESFCDTVKQAAHSNY